LGLTTEVRAFITSAVMRLPARTQAGRTIADLAGAQEIGLAHLVEAIQHRPRRVE
jgi:predicted ATPase with chaperone activity